MISSARKLATRIILIGLFIVPQVPAIDGDYSNPYATGPGAAQGTAGQTGEWKGTPVYGGRDEDIPLKTMIGAGLLLIGFGITGFLKLKNQKQTPTG